MQYYSSKLFAFKATTHGIEQDQRHDTKVKHLIQYDAVLYAKAAWNRVVRYVYIATSLAEALLQSFNRTSEALKRFCVGVITRKKYLELKTTSYVGC